MLFHAPILGAGTSIPELFRLGGASGAGGSVGLLGYDWQYEQPIVEEVDYRVEGGIVGAERHVSPTGAVAADDVAFCIELTHGGALVARVTNRWRFRRIARDSSRPAQPDDVGGELSGGHGDRTVGDAVGRTGAVKTWPLCSRPLPGALGPHGHRGPRARRSRIIQAPLILGYVANMLMAWSGPASIRRLTSRSAGRCSTAAGWWRAGTSGRWWTVSLGATCGSPETASGS